MLTRRFRFSIWKISALLFITLTATVALAIDAKQLAEAQALIDRAEKLSSITLPGSDPFMLQLRVDGTLSKIAGTGGLYKLWWAAPDKWREAAEFEDLRQVRVRNGRDMWIPQVFNPKLEGIFAGGDIFPFRGGILRWDEKIIELRQRKIEGVELSCVGVEGFGVQRELCFDKEKGLLRRATTVMGVMGGPQSASSCRTTPIGMICSSGGRSPTIWLCDSANTCVGRPSYPILSATEMIEDYRDYRAAGNKMLPTEINRMRGGKTVSLIRLVGVSIGPNLTFAPYMFSALEGAKAWPACDRYHSPLPSVEFLRQSTVVLDPTWFTETGKVADGVLFVVGPDGRPQEVKPINPTGRPAKQLISTYMNQTYMPATCDGKPVTGVLTMEFVDD